MSPPPVSSGTEGGVPLTPRGVSPFFTGGPLPLSCGPKIQKSSSNSVRPLFFSTPVSPPTPGGWDFGHEKAIRKCGPNFVRSLSFTAPTSPPTSVGGFQSRKDSPGRGLDPPVPRVPKVWSQLQKGCPPCCFVVLHGGPLPLFCGPNVRKSPYNSVRLLFFTTPSSPPTPGRGLRSRSPL